MQHFVKDELLFAFSDGFYISKEKNVWFSASLPLSMEYHNPILN